MIVNNINEINASDSDPFIQHDHNMYNNNNNNSNTSINWDYVIHEPVSHVVREIDDDTIMYGEQVFRRERPKQNIVYVDEDDSEHDVHEMVEYLGQKRDRLDEFIHEASGRAKGRSGDYDGKN